MKAGKCTRVGNEGRCRTGKREKRRKGRRGVEGKN
jgi:hypothetical protein